MKLSPYLHLRRIELIVTYHCSGNCLHCSVGNDLNQPTTFHALRISETAEAIRWLSRQYPIDSVMTFGGEPLLYADVTSSIHETARACGVPKRQLITNGYFSKNANHITAVAKELCGAGVNDLLLSVDAFHQETIPLEPVLCFAEAIERYAPDILRLQPAWLVNCKAENPYNFRTYEVLSQFRDLGVPVSEGNDIFLAGRAAEHLAQYYPAPCLDLSDTCGSMPYTEPLTDITSLSIVPNGDVVICSFVIGNIYQESMETIVSRYDPEKHPCMHAILHGGAAGLIALAQSRGISVDTRSYYSVCDLCRKISRELH